jgi:electron transfer flavoprotein alpha subunit
VKYTAVIDGTIGTAPRQAQALGAFLRDGLSGDVVGETVVFYRDDRDRERLVELSPTRDVRLVRAAWRRPDQLVATLAAMVADDAATEGGAVSLFLFAGGSTGTELAARLAGHTGGAVLTGALSAEADAERLLCRRNVYSNHMVGRFELSARPWCVTLDGSWNEARGAAAPEHRIVSDADAPGGGSGGGASEGRSESGGGGDGGERRDAGSAPFEDVELVDLPSAGELTEARFLVVAGQGAGSRQGVERLAAAAGAMGAGFGVSRPVAMQAWAPMDRLVGVSGARAAPDVCLVVGASGAPALHWGVERAAFIVAINPDDGAPIVRNADAVVLDDGVAVVEELADLVARGGSDG